MEYFSFITFKILFLIFWPLPEKLLDCPKNIILPDSGGAAAPPAHTPVEILHFMFAFLCGLQCSSVFFAFVVSGLDVVFSRPLTSYHAKPASFIIWD